MSKNIYDDCDAFGANPEFHDPKLWALLRGTIRRLLQSYLFELQYHVQPTARHEPINQRSRTNLLVGVSHLYFGIVSYASLGDNSVLTTYLL